MPKMKVYQQATVRFDSEDQALLEAMLTRKDDAGAVVEEPPQFPLENALVVFNGSNATISLPQKGKKARRVCRLRDAELTEPRTPKGEVTITGAVVGLEEINFKPEEVTVTAAIEKYAKCPTC